MAKIHMTMQGKGGVGKSLISSILAQYFYSKKKTPLCIDTDPVNATFHGFKALNVQRLDLMKDDEIDHRKFDDLIDLISKNKSDVIIDNGASTFVPLSHYLISNDIAGFLEERGHELIIHTVITGSQALPDTLNGFSKMVKQYSNDVSFVIWLNSFWGKIELDGKDFESLKIYQDNKDRVDAIITIPPYKPETFGHDLNDVLQAKLTFNEAIAKPDYTIMMRHRVKMIRDGLFNQLEVASPVLT